MLRLDNSAPAIGNGPCCGQHVQLSQPGSESVLNAHASGTGKERPGFLYGVCTSAAVRPSAREWLQSLKLERRGRLHTGRWVRTLSHIVPLAAVLMDTRCLRWSQHMQTGWNPTPITTSTPSKWALASPPRTVIVNADAKSDPVWTPKIHMETHIEPGHRDSDDGHTLQDDAQSASLGLLLVPPFPFRFSEGLCWPWRHSGSDLVEEEENRQDPHRRPPGLTVRLHIKEIRKGSQARDIRSLTGLWTRPTAQPLYVRTSRTFEMGGKAVRGARRPVVRRTTWTCDESARDACHPSPSLAVRLAAVARPCQ
ncbi:hypothetical protein ACCO45_001917 [Purpureocillium lilacinum]|uniref:Uncharacterized protein n=1 Tax=Purpureocillium lilacinum TaxID=33203 RepID=A0ACC4EBE1_PURLI